MISTRANVDNVQLLGLLIVEAVLIKNFLYLARLGARRQ